MVKLAAKRRFAYFVKRCVDEEVAWSVWGDGGWMLMSDEHRQQTFPLWPAREYADACRVDEWSKYESAKITLSDLIGELLPKLADSNISVAVFPTPERKGVVISALDLLSALKQEELRYI